MLKNCTRTHDLSWCSKYLELKSCARILLYHLVLMKVNDRRKQSTWKKNLPPTLIHNFSTYSNSLVKIVLNSPNLCPFSLSLQHFTIFLPHLAYSKLILTFKNCCVFFFLQKKAKDLRNMTYI